jgi:hypothetical protein
LNGGLEYVFVVWVNAYSAPKIVKPRGQTVNDFKLFQFSANAQSPAHLRLRNLVSYLGKMVAELGKREMAV